MRSTSGGRRRQRDRLQVASGQISFSSLRLLYARSRLASSGLRMREEENESEEGAVEDDYGSGKIGGFG